MLVHQRDSVLRPPVSTFAPDRPTDAKGASGTARRCPAVPAVPQGLEHWGTAGQEIGRGPTDRLFCGWILTIRIKAAKAFKGFRHYAAQARRISKQICLPPSREKKIQPGKREGKWRVRKH